MIVFTADTKPLKLPLTDPLAYEQALSYDPPVREKHKISEFVKTRGQVEDEPSMPKPEPPKEKPQKQEATTPIANANALLLVKNDLNSLSMANCSLKDF